MKSNFSANVISCLMSVFRSVQHKMAPALIMGLCGLSVSRADQVNFNVLNNSEKGIVVLTVVVEHKLVEVPAARLLSNVLVHRFGAQLVQRYRVRQRLAAT